MVLRIMLSFSLGMDTEKRLHAILPDRMMQAM